ncbi:hypothetical protein BABINDRAFT_161759 [Babjeviella inositovora NRRL Y-12698]|uniref:Uncharacterized protein n=1 Tax=Babjeviella inositovora NRRL Y-12698 TaxID=984486 RepID=A0A1E3QNU4_9ASCO|nr:uncharacterized protein BABINDRAFT_161759 [Babjeviella inositovora NRRL Y-12698]ODQ79351.1 hypothetical protein BABINDRAFT_161759 [Babjeviella inositovora NRRL Y-12698]
MVLAVIATVFTVVGVLAIRTFLEEWRRENIKAAEVAAGEQAESEAVDRDYEAPGLAAPVEVLQNTSRTSGGVIETIAFYQKSSSAGLSG